MYISTHYKHNTERQSKILNNKYDISKFGVTIYRKYDTNNVLLSWPMITYHPKEPVLISLKNDVAGQNQA